MVESNLQRATQFGLLHRGPRLLVLPNIWDPLGAKMLEHLGFPAVATASAAVAASLGMRDGEKIPFLTMLDIARRIAESVEIPVTADLEGGYASTPRELGENVRRVIEAGVSGINLEDSFGDGQQMRPAAEQCERIRAARDAAEATGVPLFINARVDRFLGELKPTRAAVDEGIARGRAYLDSGADGLYPISLCDLDLLKEFVDRTGAPINAYARRGAPSMQALEAAGVRRLSLGPNLLKVSLGAMMRAARSLQSYEAYDSFLDGAVDSDVIDLMLGPE